MADLERSDGIRVVAVAPNFFDTPLLKGLGDQVRLKDNERP
jgi:NAD(P)-dependent dehydrogenase (short-subunit alcohol dehydrogenase family)